MIKQRASILADEGQDKIVIPNLAYKFDQNDFLVLFGSDEKISEFQKQFN